MKIRINNAADLGLSFKDSFHPDFWEGEELNGDIKDRLLEIANKFLAELKMPLITADDITLTGSIANYNWNDKSDIDLHLIIDFEKLNIENDLLKDFLNLKRMAWNKLHDIKIKGHDVEIYIQDKNEPHHSTGVYSITGDKWINKPDATKPSLDLDAAAEKADALMKDVDSLERFEAAKRYEIAISLQEKIKKMRQIGLEKDGVYSTENLAFKTLRRNGYMKKLLDFKNNAYDEMYSLDEVHSDKQRRYMCAMAKPNAKRPTSLSLAQAQEMCSGPMKEADKKKKDDRCTRIAKRKYDVWPSAYASGAVVKCRQGKIWKGVKENVEEDLKKWFARQGEKGSKGGWVDCNAPDGKGGYKECAQGDRKKKPACRPTPSACKDPGKGKKWGKKSNESQDRIYKLFIDQELKPG
jgi:hypothetical protein|tara:strand:+ start:1019 stop:2248 length:1230 start_codon:yes stop_codon:yes gene_type:complete